MDKIFYRPIRYKTRTPKKTSDAPETKNTVPDMTLRDWFAGQALVCSWKFNVFSEKQ
ncbi:hypothetical protein [Microcystis sp. M42BS1]|uniref:hypothetical protein n=1 Tax=Microcystis sp. M42BS1 TaxID=2771192 RepID=UPI00258E61C8|nr:hypothetical protein [Microcystis sp. M42BS1]MCA2570673.1 hypothetical protein [Microcystis sp. M42BS1]